MNYCTHLMFTLIKTEFSYMMVGGASILYKSSCFSSEDLTLKEQKRSLQLQPSEVLDPNPTPSFPCGTKCSSKCVSENMEAATSNYLY